MATIIKNTDSAGKIKSYKIQCCVGRDEQYRQVWRTTTIPSPGLTPVSEAKEVRRIAANWETEQKNDFKKKRRKEDKERITLSAFINGHWWNDHVMDGEHTPSSISFYRYMSEDIIDYFGTKKKLNQIEAEAVKRYINYCRKEARTKSGKQYSAATVQHHFSTLRSILEYARIMGYVQVNPCRDLPPKYKPHRDSKKIDFLTPQQAQRFMQCIDGEPLFWRCFMNVLITTGLRRGECVGLQWRDLDSEKLTLKVCRNVTVDKSAPEKYHVGKTKTGEERTVPISERVCALLMEWKREQRRIFGTLMPQAYIFNSPKNAYSPIYPTEPTRWQSKFVKRHNLPSVSPHDLRHTAASLALESGADLKQVQELLGHKDPSTTLAFYTGVTEEAQRRTVEGIESLLG